MHLMFLFHPIELVLSPIIATYIIARTPLAHVLPRISLPLCCIVTRPRFGGDGASKDARARARAHTSRLIISVITHDSSEFLLPFGVDKLEFRHSAASSRRRYRPTTGRRLTNSAYLAARNAISPEVPVQTLALIDILDKLSINTRSVPHCDRNSRTRAITAELTAPRQM